MNFSFDIIDLNILKNISDDKKNEKKDDNIIFDKNTTETYRIKRLFKIDPLTDIEVPENIAFKFKFSWDPYTGKRNGNDSIGPLYFNAINLYDYYYENRFRGLWFPPAEQYQGYYGDLIGTGKNISIKSRGSNPEKYLFRLPIIDCYLPNNHNLSFITMGPELSDDEICEIDNIVNQFHSKKKNNNFTSLTALKYYYDQSIESSPDPNSDEIKELKLKYPNLSEKEINEKYNRYWVDKLVRIKY